MSIKETIAPSKGNLHGGQTPRQKPPSGAEIRAQLRLLHIAMMVGGYRCKPEHGESRDAVNSIWLTKSARLYVYSRST